ncbi:hypothetical protein GUITHDRAFT_141806 [Guillardia theta CCMP2712]|uniref:Right handed beta helix domain-containing protein n=1 Tax=Guillardia theta (strain CCMP2712) TaxID=905079 RepID=L1J0L7_GUITC|nr:hypothetical protein GUITHDRAFT_141806 [Guillardia theta CCMP2712]EKX41832.1 hypothetical protein GUITHDRAFT_141806 [Guillardia theta CCMP2712]|eukprot:XP_005828812.1 hypothetical protein GUITHDRAFT_141806 [Guillardia theta CCMP2712]
MHLRPLQLKAALVGHSSASRGCLSLRGGLLDTSRPSDVVMSETTVATEGSTFVDVCNDVSLCRDALPLVKASEHLSSEPGNQTVPPNSEVRIRMEPTTYNLTCEGDLPIIRRMLLYGTKKPEKNASTLIGSAQIDEQHISGGGRFKFLNGSAGSILQGVSLQYSLLHCVIISKSGQGMLSSCTIGGYDEERQSGTGITLFGSQSECIVEDCTIEFCFGSCIAVILNGTAKIKVNVTLKDPDILPPPLIMSQWLATKPRYKWDKERGTWLYKGRSKEGIQARKAFFDSVRRPEEVDLHQVNKEIRKMKLDYRGFDQRSRQTGKWKRFVRACMETKDITYRYRAALGHPGNPPVPRNRHFKGIRKNPVLKRKGRSIHLK